MSIVKQLVWRTNTDLYLQLNARHNARRERWRQDGTEKYSFGNYHKMLQHRHTGPQKGVNHSVEYIDKQFEFNKSFENLEDYK